MRTIMLMMAGWLLCMTASAQKETRIYQFDKPLYGAAFYAEYTPTDRLDEDIRLMKEAHLTVMRVGESTWSLFEPQDGQFEFAWMDRIIDALLDDGMHALGEVHRHLEDFRTLPPKDALESRNHVLNLGALDDGHDCALATVSVLVGDDGVEFPVGKGGHVYAQVRTDVTPEYQPLVGMG